MQLLLYYPWGKESGWVASGYLVDSHLTNSLRREGQVLD